jgi:DNA-binding transcriptional ArsR family regulator
MIKNEEIFKALSSRTRKEILKRVIRTELHLSELARNLQISTPVISRHVKILEEAGLIKRRVVGNVHLLSADISTLEQLLDSFTDEISIEIERGCSLSDALGRIPGIEIRDFGDNKYVASVDGEEGYYIYEVNGTFPKVPVDEYKIDRDVTVYLKKIVSMGKKKVDIKVRE